MTAPFAVEVEGLIFSYRTGQPVLDLPTFKVPAKSRVFLHGPSGSGKTTLLGILAGILDTQKGRVQVLGQDYGVLKGRQRDAFRGANLGYIFQMFNLIPYLNVRRNITLPLSLSAERLKRLEGKSPDQAAKELAERLDIGPLLEKPVTELSVGQQQRVAAARALIGRPALLIADEPTSALDTAHRESFLKLLFDETERAGATILFVSHDHGLMPLFQTIVRLQDLNRAAKPAGSH